MTDNELRAFNKELGEMITRYKLRGFVGIIYDGNAGKLRTGAVRLYDPTDTQMGVITGLVLGSITEMNNAAMGSTPSGEYRDWVGGTGKEKN
jgi:hypothetical protein